MHRGEDIRKEIVAVKVKGEHWQTFKPPSEHHPDRLISAEVATVVQPDVQNAVQDDYRVSATVQLPECAGESIQSVQSNLSESHHKAEHSEHVPHTVTVSDQEDPHNTTLDCSATLQLPECAGESVQSNLSEARHKAELTEHIPHTVSGQEDSNSMNLDCSDPVVFCGRRLKSVDINMMLNAGPYQPIRDYYFPVVNNRSFNPDWFSCNMPDTTTYQRKWLSYSKSADRAFCLPCIAFSGPRGSDIWTNTGFCDWHNGVRDVQRHECSPEHRSAEIAMHHWSRGSTVSQMTAGKRNAVVEDNRKVMECVIDCVKFLASEMLAFWGNDSHEGKFQSVFKLMAKRDSSAAAYLQRIEQMRREGKKMGVNLISPGNVGSVLKSMKMMVAEKIVQNIRCQKKACLIFDSTQDYSKREASVLLMRYLESDSNGELYISERLLEVFTTGETSGSVLTDRVMADLKRLNVDLQWIVGQCYDGAGNMRGRYSGMASHILAHCSKAVYIWCHAHRLNLIVNAVAVCSSDIKNTLGLLEELYVFMCGHKRNDVFCKEQGEAGERTLQLKRVSTTRWNSSQAAVDTVLSRYGTVLQTLAHLSESKYDSETITKATGLKARLQDVRIIICMHILRMVYCIIGPASRSLQGIATDLGSAAALLLDCKKQFENMRSGADREWESLYTESVEFATAHRIPCEFPAERRRKKRRMDDELTEDECLAGKERMKVNSFIAVIDEVLQQLQSRFSEQNMKFMKQLSFFTPASLLSKSDSNISDDDIQEICDQYGLLASDVHQELHDFRSVYRVCNNGDSKTGE